MTCIVLSMRGSRHVANVRGWCVWPYLALPWTSVQVFLAFPQLAERPSGCFLHEQARRFRPFGAGVRNCLGQALATTNLHTTIAMLLSNFSMELSEEVRLPDEAMQCVCAACLGRLIWHVGCLCSSRGCHTLIDNASIPVKCELQASLVCRMRKRASTI